MLIKTLAGGVLLALLASTAQAGQIKTDYLDWDGGATTSGDAKVALGSPNPFVSNVGGPVLKVFAGPSLYDTVALGSGAIPPDTMGAVGATQYVSYVNGAVAVYSKATGTLQGSIMSDSAFWAAAGQTGTGGDPRLLYNASANRWMAVSLGGNSFTNGQNGAGVNLPDIQIAVSKTSDATGAWQSIKFTGYAGTGFGGIADYPTLAMDNNAVYIGTNNYAYGSSTGTSASFKGTTLNVIPLSSLFSGSAPTVTGNVQFNTIYTGTAADDLSRGFAIQGVNNTDRAGTTGRVIGVSIDANGLTSYDITKAGQAGTTRTTAVDGIAIADYNGNGPGRQPGGFNGQPSRIIDTSDDRTSSSAYEVNGRIYVVHTVTPIGSDYTVVRYTVVDAVTKAVLDEGDVGTAGHDYYYGSIAVNAFGQGVISYTRSGSGLDGAITVMARTFDTTLVGKLVPTSGELTIKVSDVLNYHNGSTELVAPAGRQRWGDYASITLDPIESNKFWLTGEYATFWNNANGGHPTGSGNSRWATVIAEIQADAVPEPATWAMMIAGFGMVGAAARRRRTMQTA